MQIQNALVSFSSGSARGIFVSVVIDHMIDLKTAFLLILSGYHSCSSALPIRTQDGIPCGTIPAQGSISSTGQQAILLVEVVAKSSSVDSYLQTYRFRRALPTVLFYIHLRFNICNLWNSSVFYTYSFQVRSSSVEALVYFVGKVTLD